MVFAVSLSYPAVRLEFAKLFDGSSEILNKSVDKEDLNINYLFK